jgi:hypothetical protein
MSSIKIENLYPGEAALSTEKVQMHLDTLRNGGTLDPITVTLLDACWGVRDGNNRVRAYIEFSQANKTPLPEIPCTETIFESFNTVSCEGFRRLMKHYGRGAQAFLKMPKAPPDDYEKVQTETARRIFKSSGPFKNS